LGDASIVLLYLLVALEVADVVAAAGHFHGMDGCLGAEPGNIAAGGIHATAALDAFPDEACVLAGIIIEGRRAPMGFGRRRLLRHAQDAVAIVNSHNTTLQQPLFVLLPFFKNNNESTLESGIFVKHLL